MMFRHMNMVILTTVLFTGCATTKPEPEKQSIGEPPKRMSQGTLDLMDGPAEKQASKTLKEQELYFSKSKGKRYYKKSRSASSSPSKSWVEVRVPKENGSYQIFEVMRSPVSVEQYTGTGKDASVSDISYSAANHFCMSAMNARLISPYVFETGRRTLALQGPVTPVDKELIAPYDEEEDDVYYREGDVIEGSESTIVLFDWKDEQYFAISNLFKSPDTTFRCMRTK